MATIEIELALLGPHLGDVDMEVADRDKLLNFFLAGLSPSTSGSRADPMTLKAAMQG